MAINWNRVANQVVRLGRRYGPQVASQVRRQIDARKTTGDAGQATDGAGPAAGGGAEGREVTTNAIPTRSRARKVVYDPHLDGNADPGEIVWTWVEFEERDGRGKDRPVLVVGREDHRLLGLMLSSREPDGRGDDEWLPMGSGPWDRQGRESWVRLDRVLDVPENGIRREGAVCPREKFEIVAERLRSDYGWS